jgi:hypothetical protein
MILSKADVLRELGSAITNLGAALDSLEHRRTVIEQSWAPRTRCSPRWGTILLEVSEASRRVRREAQEIE